MLIGKLAAEKKVKKMALGFFEKFIFEINFWTIQGGTSDKNGLIDLAQSLVINM
jgi:uncharacterized protein YggL (DUF469 family)